MRSRTSELGAIAATVALLTWSGPAPAQSDAARATARAKVHEGAQQLREGDYADALKSFQRAYDLVPSPKIFFNFGLAYQGLARYAEALAAFERFVDEAHDATPDALAQAREQLHELRAKVGSVVVRCDRDGADLTIDGRRAGKTPLARPVLVDPGTHQLVVERDGRTEARTFSVEAGGQATVKVALAASVDSAPPAFRAPEPARPAAGLSTTAEAPAPESPPLYARPWFWAAGAVVVAGLVTGALLLTRRTEYPQPTLGQRQVPP